jgi:hypothetical protein
MIDDSAFASKSSKKSRQKHRFSTLDRQSCFSGELQEGSACLSPLNGNSKVAAITNETFKAGV